MDHKTLMDRSLWSRLCVSFGWALGKAGFSAFDGRPFRCPIRLRGAALERQIRERGVLRSGEFEQAPVAVDADYVSVWRNSYGDPARGFVALRCEDRTAVTEQT